MNVTYTEQRNYLFQSPNPVNVTYTEQSNKEIILFQSPNPVNVTYTEQSNKEKAIQQMQQMSSAQIGKKQVKIRL